MHRLTLGKPRPGEGIINAMKKRMEQNMLKGAVSSSLAAHQLMMRGQVLGIRSNMDFTNMVSA